jgi:uncharacterized protein (DUF1919 family)
MYYFYKCLYKEYLYIITNKFIILTRDCIGYKYYNFEYNSPTIANCMSIPDFILFLNS